MPAGPVGVFDSGVGGLSILRALRVELPGEDFIYFADTAHAPYGERGDPYVIDRSRAIVEQLRTQHGIKALVVACNTATAAAIHLLRADHPDLPMVGVEPALKPAVALSTTRRIGVLATRGTLASAKFRSLHDSLKGEAEFILQACDGLADAIERADAARIEALSLQYLSSMGPFGKRNGQVDALVLGCTHYPFVDAVLARIVGPQVRLIETGQPVARQTRRLLEAGGTLRVATPGQVRLLGTSAQGSLEEAASRWLGL